MLKSLRPPRLTVGLLPGIVLGMAALASAQAIPSGTPLTFNPNGPFVPNVPVFNGVPMQGMTQQQASQMQNIMMLRALQMHGHHRPHTGVPNPIINTGPGGYPMGMPTTQAGPASGTKAGYGKSRDEKKEELRRKKDEKKLAAKAAGKVKNKATAAEKKLAREKQQADAKL